MECRFCKKPKIDSYAVAPLTLHIIGYCFKCVTNCSALIQQPIYTTLEEAEHVLLEKLMFKD